MTLLSGKRPILDPVCADAVEVARAALSDVAPDGTVGEYLGAEPEEERVVVHSFVATLPGYRGWRWAVTVMRASRSKSVTVGESVLLPGSDSLLSPTWVPWTERLRPGDLGVGDLLPTDEDDPRLEPGWNALDDSDDDVVWADEGAEADEADATDGIDGIDEIGGIDEIDEVRSDGWVDADAVLALSVELDLMRPRVLSPIGLDDAIDRWNSGDHGPDAPIAQSAPALCATCGFRLPIRGTLGHAFGLCANEISPSDGHVVSLAHGCGAHSEAVVVPAMAERPEPVIDEVGIDLISREAPEVAADAVVGEPSDALAAAPATEPDSDAPVAPELAVELGHS